MSGVFISYRREDSQGSAGRLYDHLAKTIERSRLFIDVDNIPPGADFVKVLGERVGDCDTLLAVIGSKWLSARDQSGKRRLDEPDDFVRIEIAAALQREVNVVPVLVDGAVMPRAEDLPYTLKGLARCQAMEVVHHRFASDAERVASAVRQILAGEDAKRRVALSASAAYPVNRYAAFAMIAFAALDPIVDAVFINRSGGTWDSWIWLTRLGYLVNLAVGGAFFLRVTHLRTLLLGAVLCICFAAYDAMQDLQTLINSSRYSRYDIYWAMAATLKLVVYLYAAAAIGLNLRKSLSTNSQRHEMT